MRSTCVPFARWLTPALALSGALALAGCKDDPATEPVDAGPDLSDGRQADSTRPDSGPKPDAPLPNFNMGEACQGAADCKKDSPDCITLDQEKGVKVCSKQCYNTDCPDGYACSFFKVSGQTVGYCLKKCTPSLTVNTCPKSSKQNCHPLSVRNTDKEDVTVCLFAACTSDKDCPIYSNIPCNNDGQCTSLGTGAFCHEAECALPGKCAASGICGPHTRGKDTAKVGDPCETDFDCPGNGACLPQEDKVPPLSLTWYRNGYCTVGLCNWSKEIPEFACPTGSTCNRLYAGGMCMKSCSLSQAGDCRGYSKDKGGDYECLRLDRVVMDGKPLTSGPVCSTAPAWACSSQYSSVNCPELGDATNSTKMSCRDPVTGAVKTDPKDPSGICLDDTASGAF